MDVWGGRKKEEGEDGRRLFSRKKVDGQSLLLLKLLSGGIASRRKELRAEISGEVGREWNLGKREGGFGTGAVTRQIQTQVGKKLLGPL